MITALLKRPLLATLLLWSFSQVLLIALLSALHGGIPDRVFIPVQQAMPMFSLVWQEQGLTALRLLAGWSLLAVGELDAYSGLDAWTLEWGAGTLLLQIMVAWLLVRQWLDLGSDRHGRRLTLALWILFLLLSSWGTSLAHCAGPTWLPEIAWRTAGLKEHDTTWWLQLPVNLALMVWPLSRYLALRWRNL